MKRVLQTLHFGQLLDLGQVEVTDLRWDCLGCFPTAALFLLTASKECPTFCGPEPSLACDTRQHEFPQLRQLSLHTSSIHHWIFQIITKELAGLINLWKNVWMHDSVTENRGNLYCMKAVNKLINNAPGIQTENIYSLYHHLYHLWRKNSGFFLRIYKNGEM